MTQIAAPISRSCHVLLLLLLLLVLLLLLLVLLLMLEVVTFRGVGLSNCRISNCPTALVTLQYTFIDLSPTE